MSKAAWNCMTCCDVREMRLEFRKVCPQGQFFPPTDNHSLSVYTRANASIRSPAEMKRTFVIFACLCAFACAQSEYEYSAAQYSRPTAQYQPAESNHRGACKELNERYPVPGSCDRYVECINGTAEEKVCPDGLRYNPNLVFNAYPCVYPNEYTCLERSSLQEPQATDQCPHQFGYFRTGDSRNCSGFRNCVNGVGYDFVCPEGLAFSPDSYRCDWPDQVAECDAEAFLGFKCPAISTSKELGAPAGYRFYRSADNCQKYFICVDGHPRLLYCGGDSAFDELTSSCVSADQVAECPEELRINAARTKEEEQQRLAKEFEFSEIKARRKAQKE